MYKGYVLAALAAFASVASADIIIIPGNSPQPDENIIFPVGFQDNSLLVQGTTSVTPFILDFYGAGEMLTTPDAFPTRLVAGDGAFRTLTMSPNIPGATFNSFIINIDVAADGLVSFDLFEAAGPGWQGATFGVAGNGQNFFTIISIGAGGMTSFGMTSNVDVERVDQMRMGGMAAPVPEPASLAVLGLGGLAMLRRRRAKRTA